MPRQRMPADSRTLAATAAFVVLVVAGIYGPTLGAPFYSDDYAYLVNNLRLRELPLGEVWRLATERFNPFEFLPLRDLSFRLDLAVFGLNPAGFRAVNIALYLVVCALVFVVTRRACEVLPAEPLPRATAIAALTTALFSVHPSHVEAVVWISGRKDLIAAGFALASLWAALAAATSRAPRWIALAGLAFVAALLSKATAVALMPIYAGLAWHFHRRSLRPLPGRHALWLAGLPALAGVLFLYLFHGASAITIEQYAGRETASRFLAIMGWLARLAVSPEPRYTFYPVAESAFVPMVGVGILVIGGLLAGLVVAYRRRSPLLFPLTLALCLAMPYGQLIPFGTHSLVTDRFLFLLSWPVCFLLAALASTRPRQAALALLAAAWLFQAGSHALDWRATSTLRERVLAAYPRHYGPINAMVFTELLPRGQFAAAAGLVEQIEDAEARALNGRLLALKQRLAQDSAGAIGPRALMAEILAAQKALAAMPQQAKWNIPYRYLYAVAGKAVVAEAWQALADRYPGDPAVHFNAGLWFHDAADHPQAARMFAAAVRLLPPQSAHHAVALRRYGISTWLAGDPQQAEQLLRRATAAAVPDRLAFCVLEKLYREDGRASEATAALRQCPEGR